MISAIILAAGASKRMGQPKMLLPWGKTTVLGHIIDVLNSAEIAEIIVVTGGASNQVESSIMDHQVRIAHNNQYANSEMLTSIQCGLALQPPRAEATLVCLGDQPQVQEGTVRSLCDAYRAENSSLIVPSFQKRRGHPWLVARPLWGELLEMGPGASPRDFLNKHAEQIQYVNVYTPSILADLDTPQDYLASRP
jgi:molybdenum cofactor cytidylyltransferase